MKKTQQLIIHSIPLAFGILLSFLFWKSNLTLLIFYSFLVLMLVLTGNDKRVESWIFLYGILAGLIVETLGTQISGYQSFTQPDMLGIPFWLLVSWGYGFILMKRISLIIATGSPWTNKVSS